MLKENEMVNQETVLMQFDNEYSYRVDVLDALILFSYLTEPPISLPLWKLHGKIQALKIAGEIGWFHILKFKTVGIMQENSCELRYQAEIRQEAKDDIKSQLNK